MTTNESLIIRTLEGMIRKRKLQTSSLAPDTPLAAELGLESLDLAELVVRMEEITGKDPFREGTFTQILTISDLAALYDDAIPN